MKKTNALFVLFFCMLFSSISVQAGKLKGKIQKPGDNGMISVSLNGNGGTALSSGVSNAFSFNPNVGVEVGWGNFGLGIDASTFNTKSNFDFDEYSAPLRNIDFLTVTNSGSSWRSTSVTFGPSYSFSLRSVKPISGVGIVVKHNYPKATFRLSIKGGITMNEAPDFSIMNNVTRKDIATYSPPSDFKKNALTLIPSIRFNYWLSQRIALSANVQYAMQTGQTAFTTGYKDLSDVIISPTISPDQFNKNISTAPNITTTTVGPDKYLSVGAGLIISFVRKGWDGSVKGKHAISTKGTGGTKLSSGMNSETGSVDPNQQNKKGITEGGLKKNEVEYSMSDAEVKAIAETLVSMRKGWDGTVKGGSIAENRGIEKKGIKKNEAKSENINLGLTSTAETLVNIARKGWDGTVKGGSIVNEGDLFAVTQTLESIRKGWDGSIKGNKAEYVANDADVKAISETLVNLRKGWDGSVKGNKRGINENGLKKNDAKSEGIIDNGRRISMNVTTPKQTQGATFGEKVNAGKINVEVVEDGCIILFPNEGILVNTKTKSSKQLSSNQQKEFGERMNAGLHAAGGALAQGASLLGGALPGGAIISASVTRVGNLAGGDASNAKTADKKKKKVWDSSRDDDCDGMMNLPDGEYVFEFTIEQKAPSGVKQTLQTQVFVVFTSTSNVLKTKHDTVKNSINNVR